MGIVIEKVTQIDKIELFGSKSGASGVDEASLEKGYEQMMLKYLQKNVESNRGDRTF